MAFPASQTTLVNGLQTALSVANTVKQRVQALRNATAAGDVDRRAFIELMEMLTGALTRWAAIKSLPGIGAYAQEQLGNGSLDIAAEFTAMETAASDLRQWVFDNFPRNGGGIWLVSEYTLQGSESPAAFTTAQTAGFRTLADALIATIS